MKTILVSRTDAIGDVVLTLPMCGFLKKELPGCRIIFLGSTYTEPVISACEHVDLFLDINKIKALPETEQLQFIQAQQIDGVVHVFPNKTVAYLAKKAGIPLRIGTKNRLFHWLTCNKLVNLSRKNSPYHESQLNLFLLKGLGIDSFPSLREIHQYTGLTNVQKLPKWVETHLNQKQPGQLNVILHPKSKGSAREWGVSNFGRLAKLLHEEGHKVYITGSPAEHEILKVWLTEEVPFATDLTGKLSLAEFISLAKAVDGLVACSTGTLHIAAAVGSHALGIYPPVRPVHPGRWAPIGAKADFMVHEAGCSDCSDPAKCTCMEAIKPSMALDKVLQWALH